MPTSSRFNTCPELNTLFEEASFEEASKPARQQPKPRRTQTFWLLLLMGPVVSNMISGPVTAGPVVVEVAAGKVDRKHVPVSFPLPTELAKTSRLILTHLDSNRQVPCQYEEGPPARLHWMLEDLPQGRTCRFRIERGDQPDLPSVSVVQTETEYVLSVGAQPVLRYQHATMPSDDPEKPYYRRSGFLHPIYDPQGRRLTEAMPPDHMHQHAVMFAWVNAEFEGRKIDFWNSHKKQGEIRHHQLEGTASGPVFGGFQTRLQHIDLSAPEGAKIALNETWEVRVYHRTQGFLFDWKSTLTCATNSPLLLHKNDYGGLCVRGNAAWKSPDVGQFLTSEGKTRLDGNHTRPHWTCIWGELEGGPSGLTTFCHPANFQAPQPVRLHPHMPYLSVSPVVAGPFRIEPEQPYVTQYRFFAQTGKPNVPVLENLWLDYAEPVTITIVP